MFQRLFKKPNSLLIFSIFSSVLIASYGPMASYSSAQAADAATMSDLRQQLVTEIQKRLDSFNKTLGSFKADVKVSATDTSASVSLGQAATDANATTDTSEPLIDYDFCKENSTTPTSTTPDVTDATSAVKKLILLPCGFKDQAKQFLQKIVEELNGLMDKTKSATSTSQLQSIGNNINGQSGLDQLTNAQGLVTQAVSSMSSVLTGLQSAFGSMQEQVTKLTDCAKGSSDGSASASASASTTEGVSIKCDDTTVSSLDTSTISQAQSQLGGMTNIISTVSSVLLSAVTLLTQLMTQFSSLTGGMGSLDSLGNLSNLGNLGNLGSLGGLANLSSLGGLSNLGGLSSVLGGGGLSSLTGGLGSFDLSKLTSGGGLSSILSDGGLSSLGSLGNISNLGNIGSLSGLGGMGGLLGNAGSMSSMTQSLSSILTQLNISNSSASGMLGGLSSLSSLIGSSGMLGVTDITSTYSYLFQSDLLARPDLPVTS